MRFKKGSKEAKAFMAKLRAKRATKSKIKPKPSRIDDLLLLDEIKGRQKKIGSTLKLTPKETRLGATKKDFKPKSKSYHKDTKSHNVNIRVVSGINGIIINDIKVKYDSLTKWNKVLESLNTELKNTSDKGLKGAIKTDIFRVKNVIKDIKKDISSSQRKVK